MRGHGQKFARKHEAAIAALLAEPTIEAAAKRTGIGPATLLRWMQDASFERAYRRARREAVTQATAQLQRSSGVAVQALRAVAESGDAPPAARVSAARAVLEIGLRAVEFEDLAQRIAALEQASEERRQGVL